MFVEAANAMSWIEVDFSGAPLTTNLPFSNSRSSSEASRRCAAIFCAFARIRRETMAVAAPETGVERLAYVPRP